MKTTEERQALISLCKIEIRRWKAATEAVPDRKYMVALMEISLAALTAEPVAREVKGILCHTKEEADKYVGTPVPLIESLIDNTAQQYEALGKEDKC